jgi:hypothetical protein
MAMYVSKQPVSLLLPAAHKPWTSCCPRWPATSPAGWSHSSSGSTKDPAPPTSGYGEHCCAVVEEAEGPASDRQPAGDASAALSAEARAAPWCLRAGWLPPASPRPSKSDWHGERIPTLEPAYSRHCCCQLRRRDCRRGGKPGSRAEQHEGIRGVPQRLPSRHPAAIQLVPVHGGVHVWTRPGLLACSATGAS